MKITTQFFDDEVFTSNNDNNNSLTIDMRSSDEKKNFSPVEMLLSALSACVGVEVVSMIKKRRKTVTDLIITAEGKRRSEHPRSFTDIRLHVVLVSPDANDDELHKVTKLGLEGYCSVGSSLSASISFTSVVERP